MKKVLVFVHLSLVLIFIIGPFLPGKYLLYYLFLWPLVYIHWYFNDDRCMLTELEYNNDTDFFSSIRAIIYYRKDIVKWLSKIRKHFIFRFLCDSCKS